MFSHQVVFQCKLGGTLGTAGLGQGTLCRLRFVLVGTWLWTFVVDTMFPDKTSTRRRGCIFVSAASLCQVAKPIIYSLCSFGNELPAKLRCLPLGQEPPWGLVAAETFTAGRNRGVKSLWKTHWCCVWSEEGICCQCTSVFITICGQRTQSSDFCISPKSALWHLHLVAGPSKADPQGPAFLQC